MKVALVFILFFLLAPHLAHSQRKQKKVREQHYQHNDVYGFTYGFSCAYNFMHYRAVVTPNQLMGAEFGRLKPGFSLAFIGEYKLSDHLALRVLPGIDFGRHELIFTQPFPVRSDEELEYRYEQTTAEIKNVYGSLPLMLKYKADRKSNFRPYLAGGMSFKYNFTPKWHVESEDAVHFRTKPADLFFEAAFGTDVYLPFCKLGIEVRFSLGLLNLYRTVDVVRNTGSPAYINVLNRLNARMFSVGLNFE